MLSEYFYHSTIRRVIAAFGTIFNDIKVIRKDNNGEVKQITRVPLAYGPKQKFLARIESQPNLTDPKVAIKLPRLSFEITGLTYDSSVKLNRMNRITRTIDDTTRQSVFTYAPYRMTIQLAVMAKNQDDALQVIEQIIPYFQPEYTITLNSLSDMDIKSDVPIVLTSVGLSEDYEGDFLTRRAIVYTLDFDLRIRFFGPISAQNLIQTVSVDLNDADTFGFLEEVVADGTDANNIDTGVDEVDDNEITP